MNELQQIIEKSKITDNRLVDNLRHPYLQTEFSPREVFGEIKENTDTYFQTGNGVRMLGLSGLRGTGKTTLLWQTAEHIFNHYTRNIFFFNFSDLITYNIGLKEIKQGLEKYIVRDHLSAYKDKIVLIFDEVHESPMWAKALKALYDEFRIAFILVSGSSALLLQSTADLVTRMITQHILPLSFSEYMGFTHPNMPNINESRRNWKNILLHSDNIEALAVDFHHVKKNLDDFLTKIDHVEEHIYTYINYHNIIRFLLIKNNAQIEQHVQELVKRVIYEDIPKSDKESSHPYTAEKILRRIAGSDEINIQSLSQSMGISQIEINKNLDILVNAELLNILYAYGGIDRKVNKTQKYYFMSPSIRKAVLSPILQSNTEDIYAKMLEDIVVLYLNRIFRDNSILSFATSPKSKNPDLIIETLNNPILLEVGMNKTTTTQITKSKIRYKYGIIVNAKSEKIEFHRNVVTIPLKYFLLL